MVLQVFVKLFFNYFFLHPQYDKVKSTGQRSSSTTPSSSSSSKQSKLQLTKGGHVKLQSAPPPSTPRFEFKQPQLDDDSHHSVDILSRVAIARHETAPSIAQFPFNMKRVRWMTDVRNVPSDGEGIVYWMSRDQRVQGNLVGR